MGLSLDALIKNLHPEQCKNLKKFYSDPRKFDLLKIKGVYPYDYVDSVDKLAETALPPKEAFYSRLNDENMSAMVSNCLSQANNRYIGEDYDSSKPSKYIIYLGANNLYGWAMSKPLFTHGFNWMNEEELEDWRSFSCILEVDLKCPESLHDHNDYPLAPETVTVNTVEKLIPNLRYKN